MNYIEFFFSMDREAQDRYAIKANTTGDYLRTHIFVPIERRKIPRRQKIESLVDATDGACSIDDVLDFLYKSENAKNEASSPRGFAA